MKIAIESTDQMVDLAQHNFTKGRVWEGTTEAGVKVFLVIARVAVPAEADQQQFEKELTAQPPKAWDKAIDIRLIL